MTIREGFVSVGDANLHYLAAGDPVKPMLVFLHGFPEFSGMWRETMARLSDRFFCLAPDQLGYNFSDKPADVSRYRVKALVEDVAAFLDAFPKRKFTLVAHDWGGAIGWAYALKYPDTLDRLVIINAVHPAAFQREIGRNPDQAKASQYIVDMQAADADDVFAAADFARLRHSFRQIVAKGLFGPEQLAPYRTAWSQPGAVTAMLNWYRAMRMKPKGGGEAAAAPVYDEAALMVRVKTLVLWGLKDEALLPGCINGLEQWVPDLTLKTWPEASHWLVHEEGDAVAREIAAFAGGAA